MERYTVIFLSTADISIPLFEKLLVDSRFHVLALICQPDKPAGRELIVKKPNIKVVAEKYNIPVFQPESINNDEELFSYLEKQSPDFLVTFAYGQILSDKLLNIAKFPPLNIHASLLPKYRGASPIQAAILNGDKITGISLMKMVHEMDAGPVSHNFEIQIDAHDTAGILHDKIADLAALKVPNSLIDIALKQSGFNEQDASSASYCKKISKDDGFVDFHRTAEEIMRFYKAFTPWPGIWTRYNGKRLKLVDIFIGLDDLAIAPGQVICQNSNVYVGTADSSILLRQIQLESKQCLHASQFIVGQKEFCLASLPS